MSTKLGLRIVRIVCWLAIVALMAVSLSACGPAATPAPEPEETAAAPTEPAEEPTSAPEAPTATVVELPPVYQVPRPVPVDQEPPERYRIAFLGYITNPAIAVTFSGCEAAKAELADVADVDCITVAEALDVDLMISAMETVIAKGYDAALLLALNDGVNPIIKDAIDEGVTVATYLTEGETTWETGRVFYLAQDLYGAGAVLGELMCEETGGQGKVGIITGYFGVTSHELRRMGFEDALAENCPDVEIIGRYENQDKGDVAYTQAKDMITANPDLAGIYVTAGGPFGAGQAVLEEGLSDQIAVLCFDFVPETVELIKQGAIRATIGQDLWGQGHDATIMLYNYLVTGEVPAVNIATGEPPLEHGFYPVRSEIATRDNVDEVAGRGEEPWTPE
jgi:ribose transport system substrate-binding protein